jgi:hypothetical protein
MSTGIGELDTKTCDDMHLYVVRRRLETTDENQLSIAWKEYDTPQQSLIYCLKKALQHNLFYSLATCSFSSAEHDWDVMLKPVALEQMQQMEEVWNALPSSQKEGRKSLNLLLGVNYDAVKVYEHKASHFSPTLVTIFNMPPFLRYKKGVGSFYVVEKGRAAEDDGICLQTKLLDHDLILLGKGVMIDCIDQSHGEQSYFVQSREIKVSA